MYSQVEVYEGGICQGSGTTSKDLQKGYSRRAFSGSINEYTWLDIIPYNEFTRRRLRDVMSSVPIHIS